MPATDARRRAVFWRPETSSVSGMLRVEREDRARVTYSEHFSLVVIYEGAFDGWYRGREHSLVAGSLKLKEPGEVHRDVRVYAPFTLQAAGFSPALMAEAADALGARGAVHFKAPSFRPGEPATRLAFALHAALVRADASELERTTRVSEALSAVVGRSPGPVKRAPLAVRRARELLHDAVPGKLTLDELADHARLDKFHLVRAFRAEVGLPPYEYLTYLRVSRARELLQGGATVAEAAQVVGFYDESQLFRHFRRIVGVTPGAYAKSFWPSRSRRQHRPSRSRRREASSRHD